MRKIIVSGLVLATAAVPAVAGAKEAPSPYSCTPKTVGYKAKGTLVSKTLTQTAGADTEKRGDDRYSGEIVVDVTRANHDAAEGEQTITLTNARVKFHPRNDTNVQPGDRVKVSGKLTKLPKRCDATGFEPTLTAKKVDFKRAKA